MNRVVLGCSSISHVPSPTSSTFAPRTAAKGGSCQKRCANHNHDKGLRAAVGAWCRRHKL
jgi:hypothetical protein